MTTGLVAIGFNDPVGDGSVTTSATDGDGYYAVRNFRQRDTDDGNATGLRHLGTDWNATYDEDELAYATYGGTVAFASRDAGGNRGGVVMLNHTLPDGTKYTTVFMHLTDIPEAILNGSQVTVARDQYLGHSGFVTQGTGLHVHDEVREGHQTGLSGVGYGYFDGNTGASLVGSGTTGGVDYADVRMWADGPVIRYLDPIDFTNKMRVVEGFFTGNSDVIGITLGGQIWHALSGNDTVYGSASGDYIYGDSGRDVIFGNGGVDTVVGGLGYDLMSGGSGTDYFKFNAVSEIGKTTGSRDVVRDFNRNYDYIDLRGIDANFSTSANDAFKFVSAPGNSFSGIKGQLRWYQENLSGTANDKTIIAGDTNGDRVADFRIELTGLHALNSSDFFL